MLVVFSYFYIDKPLAIWLYTQNGQYHVLFTWLSYLPNCLIYVSATLLFGMLFSLKLSQLNKNSKVILAIFISTCAAIVFVKIFKFLFGRIGPEYWIANQLDQNAYGFYLFRGASKLFQDFPSGHSAVGFAAAAVIGSAYPKFRWVSVLLGISVFISLLGTNSHFLGDCIAGAFLGAFLGVLSTRFLEVNSSMQMQDMSGQTTTG